jgi:hypothetical protein
MDSSSTDPRTANNASCVMDADPTSPRAQRLALMYWDRKTLSICTSTSGG